MFLHLHIDFMFKLFSNNKNKSKRNSSNRTKSGQIKEDQNIENLGYRLSPEDKERMIFNPGKSLKSSREDVPKYLQNLSINSTATFLLTYSISYIPGKISSAILASLADRGPVIFHNKIYFTNILGWERVDAISIFSAPLVVHFLEFVLFSYLFNVFKNREGIFRLVFFWLFCHSLIRTIGFALPGIASNEEFGYLSGWLYFGSTTNYVICFLSCVLVFLSSFVTLNFAINTSYSKHLTYKKNRYRYISFLFGIPFIVGTTFITLLHLLDPESFIRGQGSLNSIGESTHELLHLLQFGIIYVGMLMFLSFFKEREFTTVRDLGQLKILKTWILISLFGTIFIRFWLDKGWFW